MNLFFTQPVLRLSKTEALSGEKGVCNAWQTLDERVHCMEYVTRTDEQERK